MNKLIIRLLRFYQQRFPHQARCRYHPTCSQYALESFQKFNFFKAAGLSIYRIIRCNPLSKGGYDPVPLTKKEKQAKKDV
ncbi:MAG: membrane protein insertion efficiency factor YidD [Bacilli bacterium]|nr:membrane protein insertion efficiency factor YidD [Bacilli bacterium]